MVRRILVGGVAAVALVVVLAMVAFAIGYWRADVPQPGELQANQVATITYSDGHTPLAKVVPPQGNRQILPESEIPDSMKNAIMAIEDRDFLTNPGFSIKGFARALWKRVPGVGGGDAGGGSTITQQYVKNAVVGDEDSLWRKWRELIISTKMNSEWSKSEIMAAYLNTIYFGRGAYGLQAAAKTYFNIDAKNLDVAQAAVLAALVRGPSLYDPATEPENARGRWNDVLKGMVEMKTLTPAEQASMQYPKVQPLGAQADNDDLSKGPNGLIKTQVIKELKEANISESELNTLGLKITTTIDKKAQDAAVEAAHDILKGEDDDLRTAIVSVDPKTGGILAYYGGDNGNGYDRVQAALQTGSSFKVFALVAALEQGIGLDKVYSSAPYKAAGGLTVTNSDGESCGSCNLATAMKMSLNTVYYRLMMDLDGGSQAVADAAHKAGVAESFGNIAHTLQDPNGSVEGGVVLGQYLSRPLDMASAYATIAAEGIYRAPHLVTKVTTADGRVLLDRGTDSGERRMSKDVANNVTAALEPIAAYSRGNALAGGRPSAAKTGTAQYQDTGENKDAWMVGYTPSDSTAVWVGTDKGGPIENSWGGPIYGSGLPAEIWKEAMDGALKGTDEEDFPTPGAIGGQAGVPYTPTYTPTTTAPRTSGAEASGTTSAERTIPGLPGVTIPRFPWETTTRGNPNDGYPTGPGGYDGGTGGSTYGNGDGGATYGNGAGTGRGAGGTAGAGRATNPVP